MAIRTLNRIPFLFLESKRQYCGTSTETIDCDTKIFSPSFALLIVYRRRALNPRPFVMMWLQTELEKILKSEKRMISAPNTDTMRFIMKRSTGFFIKINFQ